MARKGKNKECIAIAKDVLLRLRQELYVATSGTYVNGTTSLPAGDLQKSLKRHKPVCEVCAVGSMFLSTVRKYDAFSTEPYIYSLWDVNLGDYIHRSDAARSDEIGPSEMKRKLREFFTISEIRYAENDFEGGLDCYGELEDDHNRLVFIMKEIVRQNGNYSSEEAHKQAEKQLGAPIYRYL